MQAVRPNADLCEIYTARLNDFYEKAAKNENHYDYHLPWDVRANLLSKLLIDFPEFLCEKHSEFIAAMPSRHIDLRNIISCAFPPNMHLPDPLTPGLKVEMIAEIHQHLQISPIFLRMIESMPFKQDLDSFLEVGKPASIIPNVQYSISPYNANCRFNVQLINAIVLYVGTKAIDYIYSKGLTPSVSTIAETWHGRFFSDLLKSEVLGRLLILTTICNQLTYPNSRTHYFSCMLQYLFSDDFQFSTQEEIASVLVERLAYKPHPWGLLITTKELMMNPLFEYFTRYYVHNSPAIKEALLPMDQKYEMLRITPRMIFAQSDKDASKSKAAKDESLKETK